MSSSAMSYEECAVTTFARSSEESLVNAAVQGDTSAFEKLAVRHKRIVMGITRRMTGSVVEAEDLTQQAFMKAFANITRFGGRCSFSTWLISIAMNEARMWLRKARTYREVTMSDLSSDDNLDAPVDFMDTRPSPEAHYSQSERSGLLFSELERLTPGIRAALQLCDLEERTSAEASSALGVSTNGVKSRRHRGRAILRKRLEAKFGTHDRRAGDGKRSRTVSTESQTPRVRMNTVKETAL